MFQFEKNILVTKWRFFKSYFLIFAIILYENFVKFVILTPTSFDAEYSTWPESLNLKLTNIRSHFWVIRLNRVEQH